MTWKPIFRPDVIIELDLDDEGLIARLTSFREDEITGELYSIQEVIFASLQ
jgi:hypothetical protein